MATNYMVIAIYPDNNQPYASLFEAESATQAFMLACEDAGEVLTLAAVLIGKDMQVVL